MTRVAILAETTDDGGVTFRAVAGDKQSVGKTAGEALDALATQLPDDQAGTLVIVQTSRADRFFSAEQRQRLADLMGRWRAARDQGKTLPPDQQSELDALVASELAAAADRTKLLLEELTQ